MKNALNNQVGMLGDMFLWLVANLKQGVIYFIKQACGNDILASVYSRNSQCDEYFIISFLLFISDVHKKHVMNVLRYLKNSNLFSLINVMKSAETATFVKVIIKTVCPFANIA